MEALAKNGCRGVSWPVPGGKNLPLYPLGKKACVCEAARARAVHGSPKGPDRNGVNKLCINLRPRG